MSFITKKKIHGNEYYYLVERKRENGKVKSKTLGYLGKNKKEAEAFLRYRLTAKSDNQAKAQAIIETRSRLDVELAEYEVAKAYLWVAVNELAREGNQ